MLRATNEVRAARDYLGRLLIPVILAALVTLLCFLIMQHLIATTSSLAQAPVIQMSAPIVTLEQVEETREIRPKPIKVMPSEPPVSADSEQDFDRPKIRSIIGQIAQSSSLADIINEQVDQFQFSAPVTDLVPVMVVNPVYPFAAQVREIEGEVLVEFSVSADGRVVNPWIVEATPEGIFNRVALKAIQGFRFRAPRLDGESFPVSSTRLKFYFRLEDLLKGISLSLSENEASRDDG